MFGSIVVGTDGSSTAQEAVRQASELAGAPGAKVYLVSAYEPVPEVVCATSARGCPRICNGWSTRARTRRRPSLRPRER